MKRIDEKDYAGGEQNIQRHTFNNAMLFKCCGFIVFGYYVDEQYKSKGGQKHKNWRIVP
ncbi:MAG: hypothetical protein Q4D11_00340 [Rhodospirillales bacterium]|nr:hypothetical protein [Rhodospirillales bacterium]